MDAEHWAGMPAPGTRADTPVESEGLPLASTLAALPGKLTRQRASQIVCAYR